ncbi:hypothetical protein HPP92_020515 [Vanilla planifolia]|uniref:Uncharacterized protein n=1 Tax=Vanilla planifolia TaxID=51239 RepID=A0A835Q5C3_VANPL|nr:hypothetical protein HPP92_020515 [Vanilla planifolia]
MNEPRKCQQQTCKQRSIRKPMTKKEQSGEEEQFFGGCIAWVEAISTSKNEKRNPWKPMAKNPRACKQPSIQKPRRSVVGDCMIVVFNFPSCNGTRGSEILCKRLESSRLGSMILRWGAVSMLKGVRL